MTDQTPITEPKELSVEEIKATYPDEWVLIGDPVMDESGFNVLSGTPLYHSRDKREVAYLGREKRVGHRMYTLLYTGTFQSLRSKIVTLYNKNVVNMTDQTPIPDPKELSMAEIKAAYPNEWVLIGDPVMDEKDLNVVSGILIDHSRDKRELAYRWRGNLAAYKTYTFKFIREDGPVRQYNRFIPLITRRISYELPL